jgi:hypothetical protein
LLSSHSLNVVIVDICHGLRLSNCLMGNPHLTFSEMQLPVQH